MCGIVGAFSVGKAITHEDLVRSMADELTHRGPDDSGLFSNENLAFGFRRLSIIDLSHGNQPLFNEDESVVLVCNGEIFNYEELRHELLAKGHRFRTGSDIEVIVHLYEECGMDLLHKLNGQFAFALYDRRLKQLFLARDHVGIAPLFYYQDEESFLFASEIKALLKYPGVQRQVNLTGLDQVLTFPGLVSPVTMFQNIHCLKPGHYMTLDNDGLQTKEYWDMTYPLEKDESEDYPESYYTERLDDLLAKAVDYRLKADVPVGFYLSGGLDSSLIAAYIHKLYPDVQRHSFSITFNDSSIDESRFQKFMASQVNSRHHEQNFGCEDIANRLKAAVYHAEMPLKESYNTCSLALSQAVRKNNLKVVLTGEGADEMFAGYVGYRFDQGKRNHNQMHGLEGIMEDELRQKLWGDPGFFYERDYYAFQEVKEALYSDDVIENLPDFDSVQLSPVDKSKLQGRSTLHKRSYIDFKLRISDHLLADHGDRVGFANSVEARYPFLDINLLEFVKTIPSSLKLKGLQEKYILKKCAQRYLPKSITEREKFSFVAPGSPYLLKQQIEWIDDILSYETIKRQGYFNPDTVERLKKMYQAEHFNINQTFENDLLMIVLTFGIFLEVFER